MVEHADPRSGSTGDAASVDAMDAVFRALADDGRRALLDALRERDGQRLNELCDVLPDMTRFGVMKHLKVLEAAHVVTTERDGRSKRHYLNPVPIRDIHDRWISRYAEPFVDGMIALRSAAELATRDSGEPSRPTPPTHTPTHTPTRGARP
jgi:DNA-binding transcriptional ArsR family regulator